MNCCALLFLLLLCGCGNCGGQRVDNCGCHNHKHYHHCHEHNNLVQPRTNGWECEVTCQKVENEERESECCCNENAGMIPPPWVRVDDGRDNQSCGCNKH